MTGLRAALGLLTVLPAGRAPLPPGALRAAPAWFPLVGVLVGAAAAGAFAAGDALVGAPTGAALALVVSALACGALHHDGLADTADGLGARGAGPERRLAAMRDHATGAFGVLALVGFALVALTALAALDAADAARALIAGHVLGRWTAVLQLAALAPARADGLGAAFGADVPRALLASATAAAVVLPLAGPGPAAVATAAAGLAAAVMAGVARRTLGGRTGDTLGASVLVAEAAVYLTLAATWA